MVSFIHLPFPTSLSITCTHTTGWSGVARDHCQCSGNTTHHHFIHSNKIQTFQKFPFFSPKHSFIHSSISIPHSSHPLPTLPSSSFSFPNFQNTFKTPPTLLANVYHPPPTSSLTSFRSRFIFLISSKKNHFSEKKKLWKNAGQLRNEVVAGYFEVNL